MKNVIAYVRVSTGAQAMDDKFGVESQKEIIFKYCEQQDMSIMGWYIDQGENGVKEYRPQLDAILYGEVKNPPVEGQWSLPSLTAWQEISNCTTTS